MSVNVVALSGNIGRDPEIRATQSGTSILNFSLAVNERIKKGDDWSDYTNWVDIVVFGKRADSLGNILSKGMKVSVSGHLRYSTWERDGIKRSKLEVIADDVDIMQRKDNSQNQQNGSQGGYNQQPNNYTNKGQYGPQNAPQQPTGGNYGYQQQGYQEPDLFDENLPF